MILTVGGKTDRGLVRAENEDTIYFSQNLGLLVVADGMGGHAAGETASRLTVNVLRECFRKEAPFSDDADPSRSKTTNRLAAAISQANRTVYEAAQSSPDMNGMGTTVAAAVLDGNHLSFAHIGDSRIYLVRSGSITQLTEDHSLARKLSGSTRQIGDDGIKNVLTKALGTHPEIRADLGELTVLQGDILLLCSDGLYNMVSDEEILEIAVRAGNVHAAAEILIDTANDNGGADNISVVIAYFRGKKWYASWSKIMDTFRR